MTRGLGRMQYLDDADVPGFYRGMEYMREILANQSMLGAIRLALRWRRQKFAEMTYGGGVVPPIPDGAIQPAYPPPPDPGLESP